MKGGNKICDIFFFIFCSYNTDGKHGRTINFYSDDHDKDKDGETLGNNRADNTKMLNERRFMYELIGDESISCTENFGKWSLATFKICLTFVMLLPLSYIPY